MFDLTIFTLRKVLRNRDLCNFLGLDRPVTHWSRLNAAVDVWVLKTLNALPDGLHERINKRHELALAIAAHKTSDGMLYVNESGMDCDCVRYSGRIHHITASIAAFVALEDSLYSWADGPFSLSFLTQDEAEKTQYRSRDLALEAYENGHRHYISVPATLNDVD